MLNLILPEEELFDDKTQEFIYFKPEPVTLEHSLISLSKWEAHYKKPFISTTEKTPEETMFYISCMVTKHVSNINLVVHRLCKNKNLMEQIEAYIADPMCATTIQHNGKQNGKKEVITAEIIYYDMIALQIPKEYEKWHLNRLMTLIEVCSIKNQPDSKKNKMTKDELYARQEAVNEANKARLAAMKANKK